MKRFVSTAVCVLIALALVCFGLGQGARQGWQQEYEQLEALYAQMRGQQAACAANLKAVALRYLPRNSEPLATFDAQEDLAEAVYALAEHLLALPAVQASPRDQSYVDSLRREMEQLTASGAAEAYRLAAEDYDQRLGSTFSGTIALALRAPLSASIGGSAAPQPRYPQKNGPINDFANVLSAQTVQELNAFAEEVQKETGASFYLATVHFLDGQEISAYAQSLAARWELGEKDLLVLLAVGQDAYHAWAGSELEQKIPSASRQILLSQQLHAPFLEQQYDRALTAYIPALADALGKAYGESIALTGSLAPAATAAPVRGIEWSYIFDADEDDNAEDVEDRVRRVIRGEEKRSGISLGKTIALAFVLYLIFGDKKKGRSGCMGCGCSPIGWLLAAFGLQKFFDND